MQKSEFIRALEQGQFDDFLDDMGRLARNRQIMVARAEAEVAGRNIQVGDRIRITSMRPRCFERFTGTVTAIVPGNRVEVDMDIPAYLITQQMRRYLRNGTRKTLNTPIGTFVKES
jgi:hypothetical protein